MFAWLSRLVFQSLLVVSGHGIVLVHQHQPATLAAKCADFERHFKKQRLTRCPRNEKAPCETLLSVCILQFQLLTFTSSKINIVPLIPGALLARKRNVTV